MPHAPWAVALLARLRTGWIALMWDAANGSDVNDD